MAQDDDKAELIAELARTRARLTESALALRHDLDFSTRARTAFKRSPLPWIGGALLAGLIIARLTGKKGKVATARKSKAPAMETAGKAGLVLGALKIAFDFARPALLHWATERFSGYVAAKGQAQDFRPRNAGQR
jgi:hypothetical protein